MMYVGSEPVLQPLNDKKYKTSNMSEEVHMYLDIVNKNRSAIEIGKFKDLLCHPGLESVSRVPP